jgi:hypothetical protein
LVVDEVGGVHQGALIALERVSVELQHEHRTVAGNHHGLLRDGPGFAVPFVGGAELPGLKPAQRRGLAFTGALVAGEAEYLVRGVLDDLRRVDVTGEFRVKREMVGGSAGFAGCAKTMPPYDVPAFWLICQPAGTGRSTLGPGSPWWMGVSVMRLSRM